MADDSNNKRRGDYHVVPNDQAGWSTYAKGGTDVQTFATQDEAIRAARNALRAQAPKSPNWVHVYRKDGALARSFTVIAKPHKLKSRPAGAVHPIRSGCDREERDDFEADLEYLLNKNAELYRRLAR